MSLSRALCCLASLVCLVLLASDSVAQHNGTYADFYADYPQNTPLVVAGSDIMDTTNNNLWHYRRLYRTGTTPQPQELAGQWNGVNKGIVEVVGYRQFVKSIDVGSNGQVYGDNIQVQQVQSSELRTNGWQTKFDYRNNLLERRGGYAVQAPTYRGYFGQGAVFSYANGNNPPKDPARLLEDQVVRIGDNHMLGRAVAKFGPIRIPLSYFILERRP